MVNPKKVTPEKREKRLIEKIEQAKKELARLQEIRKMEIGNLAYKHGLAHLDNTILEQAFIKLANGLTHEDH